MYNEDGETQQELLSSLKLHIDQIVQEIKPAHHVVKPNCG
jgi:hypothetical protein